MNAATVQEHFRAVADPGFPVGGGWGVGGWGGVHPLGGRGPPTWALFGENVCENERIGSHRGAVRPARPPRSANALGQSSTSIFPMKKVHRMQLISKQNDITFCSQVLVRSYTLHAVKKADSWSFVHDQSYQIWLS